MIDKDILKLIPPQVLEMRTNRQLHKVAEARTGINDFGLDSAVTFIAKKAYYNRHINKAIASAINAVDTLGN
tara:strand:+ start:667 stop:882 length:216 start_codon:yes stop_codon:yes gene_type:complete